MLSWVVLVLALVLVLASVLVLIRPVATPALPLRNLRVAGVVGVVLGLAALGMTLAGDPVYGLAGLIPLVWLGPLALRSVRVPR